jgi:hypothetical protein
MGYDSNLKVITQEEYEKMEKNIYPVYNENGQHYELGQVYQCNLKNKRVRLLKVTSTALPFGFPENGIH